MQGTVADFDEQEQRGSVLLDDGTRLAFAATAFAVSGLRLLRVGQRVRLDCDDSGRVVSVGLITLR
jgi:cold shock CspA family protein